MPTYEYMCSSCNKIVEITHSISAIDNPTEEVMAERTCTKKKCIANGNNIMMRYFGSAPAISTMTGRQVAFDPAAKAKIKADRKKRNDNHFKKKIYPTLDQKDRAHFAKKHGLKA